MRRSGAVVRVAAWRAAALLAVLATGACGNRGEATKQAKAFFRQHRQALSELAAAIAQCKGAGTSDVFASGELAYLPGEKTGPTCSNMRAVTAAIGKAGVRSAFIVGNAPYGTPQSVGGIFVLASPHDFDDNYTSAIDYYASPQGPHDRGSVPLAGTPGQWFFRYVPARPV